MSCFGCVDEQRVPGLLAEARQSLSLAQVYLRPTIRQEPRQAAAMRRRLAGLWREQMRLTQQFSGAYGGDNLGWIAPVVIGASSLITAIGAWAWKHREQAREVELRSELYNRMLEEGLSPERAAALAMGAESPLSDALRRVTMLSVVAAGIYLAYRVLK